MRQKGVCVCEQEREWDRERERHAISESVFIDYSQFCQPCLTVGVQLYEDKVIFLEWVTLILTWHTHTLPRCTGTYTHIYPIIKQALLEWAPQLNLSFNSALSYSMSVLRNAFIPQGFLCISQCKLEHLRFFFDHLSQTGQMSDFQYKKSAPVAVPLPVRQHLDLMSSKRKSHISPQLLQ